MRTNETPIFDSLAREFETQRPLIHVASALGADPWGDPLSRTHATEVSWSERRGSLPRRARAEGSPA
ncbi:hypothetical protein BCE75_110164 [Isoptericola sp. CG 20/1183]|uniref:Uncharacterized protein n=1 Tax=Isoptericola halotolerans TaxID=300560 RepID=A0ABX5EE43_9MICO|nr:MULTISPECIES: hypothetical protein [Isoptericola]PRZ04356.1 hypothetical protein BCL65_11017 [Isoptericola halotolerans]PRZ04746.1 hypothetical protein BCE75_110164 [Isoptericola sp. CG 20/1183]